METKMKNEFFKSVDSSIECPVFYTGDWNAHTLISLVLDTGNFSIEHEEKVSYDQKTVYRLSDGFYAEVSEVDESEVKAVEYKGSGDLWGEAFAKTVHENLSVVDHDSEREPTVTFWKVQVFEDEVAPLSKRISVVNEKIVDDEGMQVLFDIAVDDEIVYSTLEWLDEDLDIVRQDAHLDCNKEYRGAIWTALGDSADRSGDIDDVEGVVHDKLVEALAALKWQKQNAA